MQGRKKIDLFVKSVSPLKNYVEAQRMLQVPLNDRREKLCPWFIDSDQGRLELETEPYNLMAIDT